MRSVSSRRALGALLTLAFVLSIAPLAKAEPTATGPSGAQVFNNAQINKTTAPYSRSYLVTNTGTDPVWVISSTLSGSDVDQFAVAGTCATRGEANPLTGGQTCTVIVEFKPTTTGPKSVTLTTVTNGPTFTTGAITGTGRNLTANVPVDFGDQHVGTPSAPFTVTIKNEGAEPYTLGAIAAQSQFSKGIDGCSGQTLAAGTTCEVQVGFLPTTAGVKTGYLTIAGYAPHLIALEGRGIEGAASIAPAVRDFGLLNPAHGAGAATSFTLRNTGNEPLDLGVAELTGPGATAFSIGADGCSQTDLAGGASCTVEVAFDPSEAGWRTATLAMPAANLPVSPILARLSGRGSGAALVDDDPFASLGLADLPLVRYQGDGGDNLGGAIASDAEGCDLNGDGYDDVVAGASLWSKVPAESSWEGAAYVTFGGPAVGGSDLAATIAGSTIRIEGEKVRAQTGTGVGCAGDVNGDGIDDLVVGAWAYEYAGRAGGINAPRGVAYVVFGSVDLPTAGPLDLGLLGSRGYEIVAPESFTYDHLGYQATGVGDLDGDGLEDIALLANTAESPELTPPRTNNGRVFLLPGKADTAVQDVGTAALTTIIGASPFSTATPWGQMSMVSPVGDVNDDGTPDIGIGAYTAVAFGRSTASGAVFAVSGAKRGVVDLADQASSLFAVGGAFAGHRIGIGLAPIGDVNGDGVDDIAIGADSTAAANSDAAYVVHGAKDDPAGTLLDTANLGTRGYRILGAPGSSTGYSVAPAGDVNRDGIGDLLVGAYGTGANGTAWVVYGPEDLSALPANNDGGISAIVPANLADATRYLSLATLTAEAGSQLGGQTTGERFGRQVAAVGDLDGNGVGDLGVGSDFAVRFERTRAGELTVALLPGSVPAPPAEAPEGEVPPAGRPTPESRPRPKLAKHALKLDDGHGVTVRVSCANTPAACRGQVALTLAGVTRTRRFTVAPERTVGVRVKLTPRQESALAERGWLRGSVRLTVWQSGEKTARTMRVTVRGDRDQG